MSDTSQPVEPTPKPAEVPAQVPADEVASPRRVATSWIITALIVAGISIAFPQFAFKALVFIAVLSVLVFVHELGHFQFARWAGMKVNRFAVGFPPWIYTKRHEGVDYSIGALPIGGMVDIAGLGSEEEMVATAHGEMLANSTRPAKQDVPRGQRQFQDTGLGWRFMTLFAGPLMNFLFAIIVYIGVFSMIGVPDIDVSTGVESVISGSPAAKAGIQAGDKILAVDGKKSDRTNDIATAIQAAEGRSVTITLLRDGKEVKLNMTPVMDEIDLPNGKTEKKPMIGIQFQDYIKGYEKVSFVKAAELGWLQSKGITEAIFGILGRAATNNLSKSDKRNVGGPVKIAQVIGNQSDKGWLPVFLMAAGLSVNLGLMNLLPFPALDGGRILFLGYELIARRPFDPRKEGLVHMAGMVLLLAFMLFITFHDVLPMIRG